MTKQRVVFTVTNELSYDQRMIRICTSLSENGYDVLLIGRVTSGCPPLGSAPYKQRRLRCFFQKGFLFYAEFNTRLFFYLLFQKMNLIGAIDLDTILPCYFVSKLKGSARLYDAHELFCEMKEVVRRPPVYRIWKFIERNTVPHFPIGYTVNRPIAEEFAKLYSVHYEVIRNVPFEDSTPPIPFEQKKVRYLIYQGSVNEGRSFETLIPAMQWVDASLLIFGDGNFMEEAKKRVIQYKLEEKVLFKGRVLPDQLRSFTREAWAGITLFDAEGKSNYYSLANRFFDYVQAGIPQLCVDFPVYREMTNQFPVALLIDDLRAEQVALQLNRLLSDDTLYRQLTNACLEARKVWNWKAEERKLLDFYFHHFSTT